MTSSIIKASLPTSTDDATITTTLAPSSVAVVSSSIAGATAVTTSLPVRRRRVLLIGIDGVRVDCISASLTPTIWSLKSDKTIAANARTSFLTISAPGWASCLTGQWPARTKAFDNDFREYASLMYPTLMHRMALQGLPSHVVSSWDGITDHLARGHCYLDDDERVTDHVIQLMNTLPSSSSSSSSPSTAASSSSSAASSSSDVPSFTSSDPDFIFVHLGSPDLRGHEHGFKPDCKQYGTAISIADGHVARIINSIPSNNEDDWLIMITTDHGGGGQWHDDHGDNTPCVRDIFLFAARSSSSSSSTIPSSSSTTTARSLIPIDVPATAEIVDCTVAALHHLQWTGLDAAMATNLFDGRLFTDMTRHDDNTNYRIWWDQDGHPLESPPPVLPT